MFAMSMGRPPLELNTINEPDFTEQFDPIFGCAGTLWPLMHNLAHIISRSQTGQDMTVPAKALKHSLQTWSIESTGITEAYFETLVQIANAYKYCGLLALRMMNLDAAATDDNEMSSGIDLEQDLYQSAFGSLLRVGVLSTTMATSVWPLYVVGKLARSSSDRTVILHIFSQCSLIHNMKVVEGAKNAVMAYWGADHSAGINGGNLIPVLIG
ncbi:fungal specific transcription factor domain-containing protein [Penicillium nucicola]|uniref:fungal specific transcription factor domain-containing protein n=1 Tax=Penicillium nucicola TaxID=1850975 RepID=UPI002544E002|nr:fungal specific transcription factor domain-containing protein [Penicillium nucicola]KAJ5754159.1 fungal specific transcription factor domain-containing protein [Penicillium nucicola]